MKTHKDLKVWQQAIRFVTNLYERTSDFPKAELYGITSQMRRAAVSIPSNIAEGAARESNKEYIRFLNIALASLMELDTQLLISSNLRYLSIEEYQQMKKELSEIGRLLNGLIKYRKGLETRD